MLGKIWKKALVIILIIACLFNIVRKIVRKTSLKEELQATLDYFFARNEKLQENQINNTVIDPTASQIEQIQQNNNQQMVPNNNQGIQQNGSTMNNPVQQQSINNNDYGNQQQSQGTIYQQNGQVQNPDQTQTVMPITQSEIEQNIQARMQENQGIPNSN